MSDFDKISREAKQAAAEVKRTEQQSVIRVHQALGFVERHPLAFAVLVGLLVGFVVGYFIIPHHY